MALRSTTLLLASAYAGAQTCTPKTSLYGPASGNPNAINGSKLDFSAFAGNVTLFTNVASF